MAPDSSDWPEYRRLVLNELEGLRDELREMRKQQAEFREKDVSDLKTDIALLKLKSSLWGAIMGGACSIIVTAGALLLRLIK